MREAGPPAGSLYYSAALAAKQLGQDERAVTYLEHALVIRPGYARAMALRAEFHILASGPELERARDLLDSLGRVPRELQAYVNRLDRELRAAEAQLPD